MHQVILLLLTALFYHTSCKVEEADRMAGDVEELLFENARIYTVNPQQEWAESMLVRNGVIVAIGTDAEVKSLASPEAEIVDLQGLMVMPGIHDVHTHPLEASSDNFSFVLNTDETNAENYLEDIEQAIIDNPNSEWILGWGFDIFTLLDADRSPLELLDDMTVTRPIAIMEQTSHAVWVNREALRLAGITAATSNPQGGIIMKDERGQPNGLLIDNAGNLIIDLAISTIPDYEEKDYLGLVDFALPELAKNGITSICDARTYWKRNHHLTWKRIEDEGKMTVRASLGLWIYPTEDVASQINTINSLYTHDPEKLLQINQVKLYADGIVINTTSAMQDDYLIDLYNLPTNNGLNYHTESTIEQYLSALEPIGFDFHIHAIGNRGVNEALNAIENQSNGTGRHRLTHVEYVLPSDYRRFYELNVTADAQVAGDFTQPANWHETDFLIDPSLNNANIPLKSLFEENARITLSSDWDVSDLNPFVGMQNAVTRSPQNLPLSEAIKAYTLNAAYVMRQEDLVGSLEVGKEADFIVLNQNIMEIQPNRISTTQVIETYLKGKLIFER